MRSNTLLSPGLRRCSNGSYSKRSLRRAARRAAQRAAPINHNSLTSIKHYRPLKYLTANTYKCSRACCTVAFKRLLQQARNMCTKTLTRFKHVNHVQRTNTFIQHRVTNRFSSMRMANLRSLACAACRERRGGRCGEPRRHWPHAPRALRSASRPATLTGGCFFGGLGAWGFRVLLV